MTTQVKDSLRELSGQLSLLNRQVGTLVELKDTDFACLELIGRLGPLSPSALARQAGLHPATVTGILDRLERAGWISRDRDPADRRAVLVGARPERSREVFHHYAGMNSALDRICADYSDHELEVFADFLRRANAAGRVETHRLADD